MSDKKTKNIYDDDNIPEIDLPRDNNAKDLKVKHDTELSQSVKDETED